MEFGIGFDTHVDKWDLARYGEELGYDRCWVPDSQMIWSDCYSVLALAAANTRRIKLGTGVAVAGTRIAPVTAFDRQHQSDRAGANLSRHRHRSHRDARDGAESDAAGRISRVPARSTRIAGGQGRRIYLPRPHSRIIVIGISSTSTAPFRSTSPLTGRASANSPANSVMGG
jgi:hypothetical protein